MFFIILVVLMLFGSDKIPDIARALGKGMAQLKNATNEIKSEIQKGTQDAGLDMNTLTGGVSDEIAKAKEGITKMVNPMENINLDVQNPIEKVNEDIIRNAIDDAKSQIVYVNDVMKNMGVDEDDE